MPTSRGPRERRSAGTKTSRAWSPGLNRAFGALCRVLEEDRPGTAARLLAALEEAADDPEESYSERVTEKMRSMLGCIQEFLLDIGNFTSPRIARVKW